MFWPSSVTVAYTLENEEDSLGCLASFNLGFLPAFGLGARGQVEFRTHLLEGIDLTLALRYSDQEIHLSVLPKRPLSVTDCRMMFDRVFLHDEKVLLNGYQSWTDTVERHPFGRMVGLNWMPGLAIDHWALDGSGDYRFQEYANEDGVMHGWTYAYIAQGSSAEMIASLDETAGMTLIGVSTMDSEIVVSTEAPCGLLAAGKQTVLGRYCLLGQAGEPDQVTADGALDRLFSQWFALSGKRPRRAPLLTGYTSWYRHYDAIDEDKILHDLAGVKKAFGTLDACGHEVLFQIDDGYATVGDWLKVDQRKFPHGLRPLAKTVERLGMIPGLWMAPFVCAKGSEVAAQHPDWLLRGEDDKPVFTGSHWGGGLALDTRNPQVRDYVASCIQTATETWGFKLLKLDFLYAACMIPHGGMNRGQLMADALDLLREAAGEDVLFVGCGVPLGPAFGKVEYCRIGCDMGLDWDGLLHMRATERERVSTRNSLWNTVTRSPLNGRAFRNDPDVVLLRDDVELTYTQRNMVISGAACFGGMLLTSDDMGAWREDQLKTFQEALRLQEGAHR